jgi:RNA polymerase sigma-70 factor (ECF subfamily)
MARTGYSRNIFDAWLKFESFRQTDQSHLIPMATSPPNQNDAAAEDLALVDRVLSGERRAFELLVRRHERRVFRVALAILGNIEDAEEAMQDTFIRTYRHMGQFRKEARFSTWLTRIAVNQAVEKRKARKNYVALNEAEIENSIAPGRFETWRSNPEELYGKHELHRMVEAAIQGLPEIYREAFVLRDVEELSAEEAAEALGIKVAALKSRLLRARLLMRETLAGQLEEPPSLTTKVVHAAIAVGTAVAMKLMRAAGM